MPYTLQESAMQGGPCLIAASKRAHVQVPAYAQERVMQLLKLSGNPLGKQFCPE